MLQARTLAPPKTSPAGQPDEWPVAVWYGADSLVSGVEWRCRVVAASGRNPPMTMLCLSRLGGLGAQVM